MQIYIHRGGEQFGPYSAEEAKNYMAAGNLLSDDLAWHEGAANWAPLGQLPGVMTPAPAARPTQLVGIPPRRDLASGEPATQAVQSAPPDGIPVRRDAAPPAAATVAAPIPQNGAVKNGDVAVAKSSPMKQTAAAPAKVAQGVTQPASDVKDLRHAHRAMGMKNMMWGGLVCVGGTAVTIYTYEAAVATPGGGTYFCAWGAIVFGGIQLVRGIIQFVRAR
jgi:hypothetical protein